MLIGLLVVSTCLVLPYVYLTIASRKSMEGALAETDRLDPGWSLLELEAKRRKVPDSENLALYLIETTPTFPKGFPAWYGFNTSPKYDLNEAQRRDLQESFDELQAPHQLNDLQIKILRLELARVDKVLQDSRKILTMRWGRNPIKYAKNAMNTLLPHTQEARQYAHMFELEAMLKAQDRDMDAAITSCRCAWAANRAIGDEPFAVSMLVRVACRGVALKRLEWVLSQGEPSEAALASMQKLLEEELGEPLLLTAARGERAALDAFLVGANKREVSFTEFQQFFTFTKAIGQSNAPQRFFDIAQLYWLPGSLVRTRAALLRYNNRWVEIAKLPLDEQPARLKELEKELQSLHMGTQLLGGLASRISSASLRDQALTRCAIALLAAERFRKAKGRWPEKFEDLVPDYLPRVPFDIYVKSALHLLRTEDGLTIYSVGPDETDNAGDFKSNPMTSGSDMGYRLWDVQKRRQAAKPRDIIAAGEPE